MVAAIIILSLIVLVETFVIGVLGIITCGLWAEHEDKRPKYKPNYCTDYTTWTAPGKDPISDD